MRRRSRMTNGRDKRRHSGSAMPCASAGARPGSGSTNSSPPTLDSTSKCRTSPRRRSATCRSNSSPPRGRAGLIDVHVDARGRCAGNFRPGDRVLQAPREAAAFMRPVSGSCSEACSNRRARSRASRESRAAWSRSLVRDCSSSPARDIASPTWFDLPERGRRVGGHLTLRKPVAGNRHAAPVEDLDYRVGRARDGCKHRTEAIREEPHGERVRERTVHANRTSTATRGRRVTPPRKRSDTIERSASMTRRWNAGSPWSGKVDPGWRSVFMRWWPCRSVSTTLLPC